MHTDSIGTVDSEVFRSVGKKCKRFAADKDKSYFKDDVNQTYVTVEKFPKFSSFHNFAASGGQPDDDPLPSYGKHYLGRSALPKLSRSPKIHIKRKPKFDIVSLAVKEGVYCDMFKVDRPLSCLGCQNVGPSCTFLHFFQECPSCVLSLSNLQFHRRMSAVLTSIIDCPISLCYFCPDTYDVFHRNGLRSKHCNGSETVDDCTLCK